MKKLFIAVGLATTLVASAQNFTSRDLLGGNQAVFLTNNTTTSYGDTGVPYTNGAGAAVYSLTNRYSTNGLVSPGTLYTNTSVYYGPAWFDVAGFSDRDGNAGQGSIAVSVTGTTAATTGAMTFTFAQMLDRSGSAPSLPATATQNKFIFAVTPTGTTTHTISTNIPSANMVGTAGWRLLSVVVPNNGAAAGVMLQAVQVNGYMQ